MAVALPRVSLGTFPTPLQHVADLAGTPDVLVKRDDLTGFAWGGNKVRTLEYVLADALDRGADSIVVAGGPTSNFAALLAVAAAGHGLDVTQVCYGATRGGAAALALSRRAGAAVEFTRSDVRASMDARAAAVADELRLTGRTPYVVPRGGATAVGACGFAAAADELIAQLDRLELPGATVVLPVGSGGSIAGLLAGLAGSGRAERFDVVGVSVSRSVAEVGPQVEALARECALLIGASGPFPKVRIVDGRGPGYGGRSQEADDLAVRVLLQAGLVADPVYNAKALLWLERLRPGLKGPVLYWSTGGALASADELITTTADDVLVGKEAAP